MDTSTSFKWRHFKANIILLCIRRYLRYSLSYRDVEEMMRERVCMSITPQSIGGFSSMLPNWTNAVGLI